MAWLYVEFKNNLIKNKNKKKNKFRFWDLLKQDEKDWHGSPAANPVKYNFIIIIGDLCPVN